MRAHTGLSCGIVLTGIVLCTTGCAAVAGPSTDGLQLWLDASDATTVKLSDQGVLLRWLDRSGRGRHAIADPKGGPKLAAGGMNRRAVLRFDGGGSLRVPEIRKATGPVAVFVVSQRSQAQATESKWQRLMSSWDGRTRNDNTRPSFCVIAGADGKGGGGAYKPIVDEVLETDVKIGPIVIGRSARGMQQGFRGDIAEILIYDRTFVTEDAIQGVLEYLSAKWGAPIAREEKGWTRTGGLGKTPKRITDKLPLSDQTNQGGWKEYETMWDEFEGKQLDAAKWWPMHPTWKGRQPSLFHPSNVRVAEGGLHLTMRKWAPPDATKGYHTYTSAAVHSKTKVKYGYFEVKARPMRSAGSSSFWFAGKGDGWRTEIDVYEIGGRAKGFERKYNMNLHVFQTPQEKRHWNVGGRWIAPWDLADDYHVYGLEWGPERIIYYVDGVAVRRVKNTHWHQPLYMIFDSETMPDWLGMPQDADLPSTYSVEYVRSWQKGTVDREVGYRSDLRSTAASEASSGVGGPERGPGVP